jgi:hypothetical protein
MDRLAEQVFVDAGKSLRVTLMLLFLVAATKKKRLLI